MGSIFGKTKTRKESTMKDFYLLRAVKVTVLALVAAGLLFSGTIANAAEPKLDEDWHFTLIPYIWVPSVHGKMNINLPESSGGGNIGINPDNYVANLKFAAMLSMVLEKGNWSLLSDIMYVNFSDNRQANFSGPSGNGLEINADTSLKATVFEIAPAYSLYRTESAKFDLLAGIRYVNIDSEATLDPTATLPVDLPSRTFSAKKDYVDPIIGFKGRFELGDNWFLPYYLDFGGFGVNNEWNWQAFGGVGYRFSKLFSMTLVYRHLQYNFDDNKLVKDLYLSGVQLGFLFRF